MIRSDQGLKTTEERIRECETELTRHHREADAGAQPSSNVDFHLQALETFSLSMKAEANEHRRICAGELPVINSKGDIGCLLIAMRIRKDWSQEQLSDAPGASARQVCRDERNEYFGIAVDRVQRILEACSKFTATATGGNMSGHAS